MIVIACSLESGDLKIFLKIFLIFESVPLLILAAVTIISLLLDFYLLI